MSDVKENVRMMFLNLEHAAKLLPQLSSSSRVAFEDMIKSFEIGYRIALGKPDVATSYQFEATSRHTPAFFYKGSLVDDKEEAFKSLLEKMAKDGLYFGEDKPTVPETATKETNPKDAVGVKKWRQFTVVPFTIIWELGVAMFEGARKYGRHNYRVASARASVYVDAAMGHLTAFWEGQDTDPDSGLSHVTKAMASLAVLRDAMLQDRFVDDRPPKTDVEAVAKDLQALVDELFQKYPDPVPAYVEGDQYPKESE